MTRTRAALALGLLLAGAGPSLGASVSPFDPPVKTVRVPLPRDRDNPQARARVSCFYFSDFVVKEIDLGEVGAAQLSVLPATAGARRPECRQANIPGERLVSPDDWTGYFDGVKGDYVIFSADDGWNGGMGFAVFNARTGKKLFDDAAKTGFRSVRASPSGLTLRYRRVYAAKCSLSSNAAECWRKVQQETGLTAATPPDCRAAYAREARRMPNIAASLHDDPAVIDYEVLVTLEGDHQTIRPTPGPAADCRPAD